MHTYVCFVFHLKYLLLCILSSPRQGPSHSARSSFSIASLYWFPCKLFIPHTHSYFHILFYTQISYEDLSYSYRVFACLLKSKTIKGRKNVKPTFSPVTSHSDQSGQHVWPVREHVSEAGLHPVPRAHSSSSVCWYVQSWPSLFPSVSSWNGHTFLSSPTLAVKA